MSWLLNLILRLRIKFSLPYLSLNPVKPQISLHWHEDGTFLINDFECATWAVARVKIAEEQAEFFLILKNWLYAI